MRADGQASSGSLFFDHALLKEGWADAVRLSIHAGRIERVETNARPGPGDERHACAVPGVANLHSHAFQRAMAGLSERRGEEDDDFWSWRAWMYRFLDELGPDDIEAIAAQAFMEMLESGFTRVAEFHYLHHDPSGRPYADIAETAGRICAAAEASGIGLTLLPVYYAQGGFGAAPPTAGQRRFLNSVDRFERLLEAGRRAVAGLPDAVVGVAPHSLRAVAVDDLRRVVELAGEAPIHIHVSEQDKEVRDCVAWCGRRPVETLMDLAPVDGRWCLIHATHADPRELERIAASGAVAGLCSVTEANLGDGVFPAADYARLGGAYGVGTDSNVRIDLSEELRLLEYGQRLARRGRNVLSAPGRSTGRTIFEAAVGGGARALGVAAPMTVGAAADIVSLDIRHVSLAGRTGDALLDGFLFAAGRDAVDCVWRYGVKRVSGGRHHARSEISRAYIQVLAKLIR